MTAQTGQVVADISDECNDALSINGSSASVAFATMTGDTSPLGSDSKEGLELRSCSGTSGERLDRGGFVLMDIEHAVQSGGFQQIEDVDRGL